MSGGLSEPIREPYINPSIQDPVALQYSWAGPYAGISAGTTRTKTKRDVIIQQDAETRAYNKADAFFSARGKGFRSFSPDGSLGHLAHCQAFDFITSLNCGGFTSDDFSFGEFDREEYFGENLTDDQIKEKYSSQEVLDHDRIVTKEASAETVGTENIRESHSTMGVFAGYRWQTSPKIVLGGELGYHHYNSTNNIEAKAQLGYVLNRALPYLTAGYDFNDQTPLYGIGSDYALTDHWISGVEYTRGHNTGTERVSARLAWKF